MMSPAFQQKLQSSLELLSRQQELDGSFASLSSTDPERFFATKTYYTTFFTSVIVTCLQALPPHPLRDQISKKAKDFLLSQASPHWSFNYWSRRAFEYTTKPYPDDLDDTIYALTALHSYDPTLLSGEVLAAATKLLITCEQQPGGPYRTWLVDKNAKSVWKDVDLVVNSNIAYFLHLQGVHVTGLTSFIEMAIQKKDFTSPYYPDELAALYSITRWYSGPLVPILQEHILSLRLPNGSWGTALQTAEACSSLIRLGYPLKQLTPIKKWLYTHTWKESAFCVDPTVNKQTHYAGSATLTTALCLECLQLFEQAQPTTPPSSYTDREAYRLVQTYFETLPAPLRIAALGRLAALEKQDKDAQICLLATRVVESLLHPTGHFSKELELPLACFSIYGWLAYTIYDDFLDDEAKPAFLPVANIALRELSILSHRISTSHPELFSYIQKTLNTLEAANHWEVTHCRHQPETPLNLPLYKKYTQLAQRSFGHALGAIIVLAYEGYSLDSPEISALESFFQHYIIARQLNDDAHDWKEDFQKGFLTPVVCQLYKDWQETYPNQEIIFEKLEKLFWQHTIKHSAKEVTQQCKKARTSLKKLESILDPHYLENLIIPIELAASQALTQQQTATEFLKAFTQP